MEARPTQRSKTTPTALRCALVGAGFLGEHALRRSEPVHACLFGLCDHDPAGLRENRVHQAGDTTRSIDGVIPAEPFGARGDRVPGVLAAVRECAGRAPQLRRRRVDILDEQRLLGTHEQGEPFLVAEATVEPRGLRGLLRLREVVVRREVGLAREPAAVVAGDALRILRAESGRVRSDVSRGRPGARLCARRCRRQRHEHDGGERCGKPADHDSNASRRARPRMRDLALARVAAGIAPRPTARRYGWRTS